MIIKDLSKDHESASTSERLWQTFCPVLAAARPWSRERRGETRCVWVKLGGTRGRVDFLRASGLGGMMFMGPGPDLSFFGLETFFLAKLFQSKCIP